MVARIVGKVRKGGGSNCALQAIKRSSMPNYFREEVAGALLAASRVDQVRRSVLSTVATRYAPTLRI
jgi:hypothetical protein